MFWLLSGRKRLKDVEEGTKRGFESMKKDILSVGDWIKHLDSEKKLHKEDLVQFKGDLSRIKEDLEELRSMVSLFVDLNSNSPFKTKRKVSNKQTTDYAVQTPVQTGVQTPNLSGFSITERAILFILLNDDRKLSYDDLAATLNKEKSTIRGQINTMKSKSEGLIEEIIERNGKKRVYIPTEMKEKLHKKQKVRVK